jgi:GNAT superfamily N-acetyltransferase
MVAVRAATFNDCAAIDDAWPSSRRPADVHHAWRWADIWKSLKDCLVLEGDRPVAIWGSTVRRPLKLAGATYYRLDYLEIAPAHRGKILGAFLIAVIASRALELGATGIVLTAFPVPGLVEFYEGTGAVRGAPRG